MPLWVKRALLIAAIAVALLPLFELGDDSETYGSDPEFVTVITVGAICLGFLLFRRDVAFALRRLPIFNPPVNQGLRITCSLSMFALDSPPSIRAPIRI